MRSRILTHEQWWKDSTFSLVRYGLVCFLIKLNPIPRQKLFIITLTHNLIRTCILSKQLFELPLTSIHLIAFSFQVSNPSFPQHLTNMRFLTTSLILVSAIMVSHIGASPTSLVEKSTNAASNEGLDVSTRKSESDIYIYIIKANHDRTF